jgi:hypothetical protein
MVSEGLARENKCDWPSRPIQEKKIKQLGVF